MNKRQQPEQEKSMPYKEIPKKSCIKPIKVLSWWCPDCPAVFSYRMFNARFVPRSFNFTIIISLLLLFCVLTIFLSKDKPNDSNTIKAWGQKIVVIGTCRFSRIHDCVLARKPTYIYLVMLIWLLCWQSNHTLLLVFVTRFHN